jgi:hypothetical protein
VPAPRAGGEPAAPAFGAPLGAGPDPVHAVARDDEDDWDEDDEERPRHPYTWLHLIVLALVAFVLGFLIVLLLSRGSDDSGSTAAAPVVPVADARTTAGLPAGPA